MAKFMNAGSPLGEEHSFLKCLHNGFSGSGKTTAMAKAARPFIIEPSPQAVTSIRSSNPDAFIWIPESVNDLREIVGVLRKATPTKVDGLPALVGKLGKEEFVFQSIVVDDLEEIQDLFKRDIQGAKDTLDMRGWGVLLDRMLAFLRALRNIPCNFHLGIKVVNNQDGETIVHDFAIQGKSLKPALPGLCNCMCYHYRREADEDPRQYLAAFRLPDKFLTKAHPALLDVENPNPVEWWSKIRGWAGSTEAQTGTVDHAMPNEAKADVQRARQQEAQMNRRREQSQTQAQPTQPTSQDREGDQPSQGRAPQTRGGRRMVNQGSDQR